MMSEVDIPRVLELCIQNGDTPDSCISHAAGTKLNHLMLDLDKFREAPPEQRAEIARKMHKDVVEMEQALRYVIDQVYTSGDE